MAKTLVIFLIIFQGYAQDFTGICQPKQTIFEKLASNIDDVITTLARNSWNSVIALKDKDWPFASFLLRYSLQEDPKDLNFINRSRASELIRSSEEYQYALKEIKDNLKSNNKNMVEGNIALQFRSGDLSVALHNVDLSYKAIKEGNRWAIDINISDIYDFAHHTPEEVQNFKIRVINNIAYRDQEKGIINPYTVNFNIKENIN